MIILCGGKTGGHIIPLIAISKKINDVIYIGNKNSLEEKICKENNILFFGLETKNNVYSIIKNNFKIKFNHIDCIISTGGFVSMPVLIYGILHRIPIYLIEGNTTFGITNKFFSYFSNKVFLAYPCKKMKNKYVITGLPTLINSNIYEHFDFDILIIGGSLGSKPLCDLIYSLNENFKIILIAGRYYKDYQNIKNVKAFEYRNDLNSLMKQAKIIISRAGAMTTYEIFLLNKVSIIIPSKKTKLNHQVKNAYYFKEHNLSYYLDEEEASSKINDLVNKALNSSYSTLKIIESQKEITRNNSVDLILGEVRK